jgi:hypothetical protein
MIAQIRKNASGMETGSMDSRMSPVARRASEKLAARLAASGGASVAAAAFGGIPGIMISLGAAGFGAAAYDYERPRMEALLRENLRAAVDDMWYGLMNDSATGVMAGVYYISAQIKGNVAKTHTQPVKFEPVPQEMPLSDERPPQEEQPSQEDESSEAPAEDEQPDDK